MPVSGFDEPGAISAPRLPDPHYSSTSRISISTSRLDVLQIRHYENNVCNIICVPLPVDCRAQSASSRPAARRGLSELYHGRRAERSSKPHDWRCEHSSWLVFALWRHNGQF